MLAIGLIGVFVVHILSMLPHSLYLLPRLIGLAFVMIPDVLSTSLLCLAVWVVWKVIKKLVFVSELDNIRGPPSDSYLRGKHSLDSWYVV